MESDDDDWEIVDYDDEIDEEIVAQQYEYDKKLEEKANEILSSTLKISKDIVISTSHVVQKYVNYKAQSKTFWTTQLPLLIMRFGWQFDWRINMICCSVSMTMFGIQHRKMLYKLFCKTL